MTINDCWYKTVCNQAPDGCNKSCVRFLEMEHLCRKSNLPESKWKPEKLKAGRDLEAFKKLKGLKDNIDEFVKDGKNLIIYSTSCGCGKTSWAINLMLAYFNKIWKGNGFKTRGLFVSVSDLLFRNKESFNHQTDEFTEYLELIRTVDLVIFDDLGSTQLKDYDLGFLFNLIDVRSTAGKSCIYTTNATPKQMEEFVGGRIFSRAFQQSVQVEFVDGDKRAMKGVQL